MCMHHSASASWLLTGRIQWMYHLKGLAQYNGISTATALEIEQSGAKPLISVDSMSKSQALTLSWAVWKYLCLMLHIYKGNRGGQWLADSLHKVPVIRILFSCHDFIMHHTCYHLPQWWIPPTKSQSSGKHFHVTTSAWIVKKIFLGASGWCTLHHFYITMMS